MKKVMLFAFSFLMMTGASVYAQNVVKTAKDSTAKDSTTTTVTKTTVEPVKSKIKSADLPQPVKDLAVSFKSQGWDTAETAYVVKDAAGEATFYIISFKNSTSGESKNINIDANGNIVKQ